MLQTVPLFGAIPGGPEMLIILLVLVLLFGANKIPKLARSTGQAMGEFQKGREEVEDELKQMREGEKQAEAVDAEDADVEADAEADEAEETERNA